MDKLSHAQVMIARQQLYDNQLQQGKVTPFVYPWDTLPPLYLVIAVCISPHIPRVQARIYNTITLLLVAGHSAYIIANRRCLTMASGYVIGLALTWGTLMTAVLLLFHDPRCDFARIEWRPVAPTNQNSTRLISDATKVDDGTNVRQRTTGKPSTGGDRVIQASKAKQEYQLVWQMAPTTFIHQIDWAVDLVTSFRGPNWNFRSPTLAKLDVPAPPSKSLHLTSSLQVSDSIALETPYHSPAASRFRYLAVRKTLVMYLFIDLVKVIMMSDNYFLGVIGIDAPTNWRLIPFLHSYTGISIQILTRSVRLLVSLWGILNELVLLFSLSSTLVYSTLPLIVNPRKFTYSPLLDIRFFPTLLGDPWTNIADKGLAGWWGGFWHQMFRFGMSEPSRPLLRHFNLSNKSAAGRLVQLSVAFGLSGILHMSGSVTSFSLVPSKPLMPLLFFLLQGLGIIIQTGISDFISKTLKVDMPRAIRQAANITFVVVWLYHTAPLLCDDFARCGIWLFEPAPISFIRGFQGQGWWHWGGIKIEFWQGLKGQNLHWWEKGIGLF